MRRKRADDTCPFEHETCCAKSLEGPSFQILRNSLAFARGRCQDTKTWQCTCRQNRVSVLKNVAGASKYHRYRSGTKIHSRLTGFVASIGSESEALSSSEILARSTQDDQNDCISDVFAERLHQPPTTNLSADLGYSSAPERLGMSYVFSLCPS